MFEQRNTGATAALITLMTLLAASFLSPAFAAVTGVTTDKAAYFPGENVTITGTATPNSVIGLQVTNPAGTILLLVSQQADSAGRFTRTFRLPTDAATGTYNVAADGVTTAFQVQRDTTPPAVGTLTFDKASYVPEDTVTFSVRITDNAAVATVTSNVATISRISGTDQDGTWRGSFRAPVAAGTYLVTVAATDASGNSVVVAGNYRVVRLGGGAAGLDVQVQAPAIAYSGQTIEIWVLTTFEGVYTTDINFGTPTAQINDTNGPGFPHVHQPDRAVAPLTLNKVHNGLYQGTYAVPNQAGTYVVVIPANANDTTAISSGVFTVNSQLPSQGSITNATNQIVASLNNVVASLNNVQSSVNTLQTSVTNAQNAITGAVNAARDDVKNSVTSSQTAITGAITSAQSSIRTQVDGLQTTLNSINAGVGQASTFILIVGAIAVITLVVELAILVRRK